MHTTCKLQEDYLQSFLNEYKFEHRGLKFYFNMITVSPKNAQTANYFVGNKQLQEEARRHLRTASWYIIHPFSIFVHYLEIFIIFLYLSNFIFRPINFSFNIIQARPIKFIYMYFQLETYIIMYHIILNFTIGYVTPQGKIILDPRKIATKYLKTYLIPDILSSLPMWAVCDFHTVMRMPCNKKLERILFLLMCFRLTRLYTFCVIINRYIGHWSLYVKFFWLPLIVYIIMSHWFVCLHVILPLFDNEHFNNGSWGYEKKLLEMPIHSQYMECLFRHIGLVFTSRDDFTMNVSLGEYILIFISYFFGQISMAFVTAILLLYFNTIYRSEEKYNDIISQVEHYMNNKQLPPVLKRKMIGCYDYKFRSGHFGEKFIRSVVSDTIRKEIYSFTYKRLISRVPLFSVLSVKDAVDVLHQCTSEIYFPNDVIFHAGRPGNHLYILVHGTVCVSTLSGKEICHLEDGDYFGEVALLITNNIRTSTVTALEITEAYVLEDKHFYVFLRKYPNFMKVVIDEASLRYEITNSEEQKHLKGLLIQKIM